MMETCTKAQTHNSIQMIRMHSYTPFGTSFRGTTIQFSYWLQHLLRMVISNVASPNQTQPFQTIGQPYTQPLVDNFKPTSSGLIALSICWHGSCQCVHCSQFPTSCADIAQLLRACRWSYCTWHGIAHSICILAIWTTLVVDANPCIARLLLSVYHCLSHGV